jgi:hypothetical protein
MGILGGVAGIAGAAGMKIRDLYKPKYTKQYEEREKESIDQLYSDRPFEGKGLGLTEAEKQGQFAEGRDMMGGEEAAEQQRLKDRFRRPGGLGLQSGMYERGIQRTIQAKQNRLAETKRRMVVENARLKRSDAYARLRASSSSFRRNVDFYNQRETAKVEDYNRRREALYGAIGETAGGVASAAMGMPIG